MYRATTKTTRTSKVAAHTPLNDDDDEREGGKAENCSMFSRTKRIIIIQTSGGGSEAEWSKFNFDCVAARRDQASEREQREEREKFFVLIAM
jgi:hypothetical protein